MKRLSWFMVLGVVAAMAIPASAQTESGFVMASNVQGGSEGYNSFDPLYGSLHSATRAINAKHSISYGVIDWAAADLAGRNSAGEQSRLANWDSGADDYESLAHWGAGHVNDPFRQTRGMVRYDEDTFLAMNTQYDATNGNNARPPFLQQIEVYEDWFKDAITTDDQYAKNGIARYDLVRAGSRPFAVDNVYEWGPEPDFTLDPNLPVDWTWVGGGATGVLQWPDGSNAGQYTYTWSTGDPNEVTREYATGIDGPRGFMRIDNAAGDLYVSEFIPQGTIVAGGTSTPTRSSGAEIDVAVWYGGAEDDAHRIYTAQYDGRLYKVEAAKQLGYTRLAGAPYPGARVTGTDKAKPVCTQTDGSAPSPYYDVDTESGQPLLGDGPLRPSGAGAYTVELYSDAKAGERHYTGLAVDAGGRVYAASERLTEAGYEVVSKYIARGADVWGDFGSVGNHLLFDPNNAPFGTDVEVDDTVLLLGGGGSTDTTQVYTIDSVTNDSMAILNLDPGNSLQSGDVTYVVYPAGVHPRGSQLKVDSQDETVSTATVATNVLTDTSQDFTAAGVVAGDLIEIFYSGDPNDGWASGTRAVVSVTATTLTTDPNGSSMGIHPIVGDPNYTTSGDNGVPYTVFGTFSNIWTSEALVDVYRDGGEPIYTIDLNALTRKDAVALSTYYHDGTDAGSQIINGVVIHGDIEVDPTVSGGDVTRLWIACASGDGSPDTNDGLGMVVVDVNIAADGSVSGVDFVAGFDDGDMQMGLFYNGSYNSSNYQPYNLFMPAQDIEFDGLGNLVYMGNRGGNDNRYDGFTAAAVATAVDTALNDPNELDGIVGIAGLKLDMNVYGFGTDFGLAFTNSPLVNAGSANGPATAPQPYVAPDVNDPVDMTVPVEAFSYQMEIAAGTGLPAAFTWQLVGTVPGDMAIDANGLITWTVQPGDLGSTFYVNAGAYNIVGYDEETFGITVGDTCTATLVSSEPVADGTLPKKQNNCLFLTFNEAITVEAGQTLSIVACNGGADVSASFTYSVEVDGVTLKVAENGEALTNQTWYRISEGDICVAEFTLDVCTLVGDADGNGQVLAGDLGKIWSKNAQSGPCFREDTDGNGQVLAGDLGLTWSHNAETVPAKVCP